MSRAALVTGASSGIGLAVASALAADGYGVTMVARQPEKLAAAAQRVGAAALAVPGDLADEATAIEAVRQHRERFGRLDVLVNSAGIGIPQPIGQLATRLLDRQLDVNVRAMALLCREAAELLEQAGAEHGTALVVNLSSVSGKQGVTEYVAYSAAKAAVIGLSQALAAELGPHGVKVTALCPALVDTPMTEAIQDQIPAATMVQLDDVVLALRMLLALSSSCAVPELVLGKPGRGLAFA